MMRTREMYERRKWTGFWIMIASAVAVVIVVFTTNANGAFLVPVITFVAGLGIFAVSEARVRELKAGPTLRGVGQLERARDVTGRTGR